MLEEATEPGKQTAPGNGDTPSSAAREGGQSVTFDRKPADVAHDPKHQEGALGQQSGHKSIIVERDGKYFKRSYYSASGAGMLSWYWYDQLLIGLPPLGQQVPSCDDETDNCGGQPPGFADNPPDAGGSQGGSKIVEDETDCPNGVIRINVATTSCVDGKIHDVDDHYLYCPPDKINYHHVHKDTPTKKSCGAGGGTGTSSAWTPGLDDLHGKACGTAIDTGRLIEDANDVGGIWVITMYHVFRCTGIPDKEFVGDPETYSDGRVADGGPTPNLDPNNLVPAQVSVH